MGKLGQNARPVLSIFRSSYRYYGVLAGLRLIISAATATIIITTTTIAAISRVPAPEDEEAVVVTDDDSAIEVVVLPLAVVRLVGGTVAVEEPAETVELGLVETEFVDEAVELLVLTGLVVVVDVPAGCSAENSESLNCPPWM